MEEILAIGLILLEKVDEEAVNFLIENLSKKFNKKVEIADNLPFPKFAYSKIRRQYNSTDLIKYIKAKGKNVEKYEKILGICDADLYAKGLNFVFGEAESLGGKFCIMSLVRLRQEFYRLMPDTISFLERTVKEAMHELGHLYGLEHCKNTKCVMYFSNSLVDTDNKKDEFCKKCKEKIKICIKE